MNDPSPPAHRTLEPLLAGVLAADPAAELERTPRYFRLKLGDGAVMIVLPSATVEPCTAASVGDWLDGGGGGGGGTTGSTSRARAGADQVPSSSTACTVIWAAARALA